jgi:hypothetical protein
VFPSWKNYDVLIRQYLTTWNKHSCTVLRQKLIYDVQRVGENLQAHARKMRAHLYRGRTAGNYDGFAVFAIFDCLATYELFLAAISVEALDEQQAKVIVGIAGSSWREVVRICHKLRTAMHASDHARFRQPIEIATNRRS